MPGIPFVPVVLDETAPSVEVEATRDAGDPSLVTLALTSPDADIYEMRIWGHVDPTDPGNGSYGEVEGDADWIAFDVEAQVRVTPTATALYVRVRDDVWNESEPVLVSLVPVVEPPAPTEYVPRPSGPIVEPRREPPTRVVRFDPSVLRVRTEYRVRSTRRSVSVLGIETTSRVRVTQRSGSSLAISLEDSATALVATGLRLGVIEETAVLRRHTGPQEEAALVALGVL